MSLTRIMGRLYRSRRPVFNDILRLNIVRLEYGNCFVEIIREEVMSTPLLWVASWLPNTNPGNHSPRKSFVKQITSAGLVVGASKSEVVLSEISVLTTRQRAQHRGSC